MSKRSSMADPIEETTVSYPPLGSRLRTAPIHEKMPGMITPKDRPGDTIRVTVQRFMGVLVHPVPGIEMHDKCGSFEEGGKIYLDWTRDLPQWVRVEVGDRLEVDGRAFTIRGLDDVPIVYSALYVREL